MSFDHLLHPFMIPIGSSFRACSPVAAKKNGSAVWKDQLTELVPEMM
jgi:hypothetical protein